MRLLSNYIANMQRCLLVIPGPSSDHVAEFAAFGHVATVNRGALLVEGSIDFAFCNDLEALEQIRQRWGRIRTFIVPDRLGIEGRVSVKSWAEFPDVPHERTLVFPHQPLTASEESIGDVVKDAGRLATFNSAGAALHGLVRLGYRQIQVVGCDGGAGYSSLLHHGGYGVDFTTIRQRMEFLAGRLAEHHGCDIRFFPDRFDH